MSVATLMPAAVRMSYTISTTQLDYEHDQASPRTKESQSQSFKREVENQINTKNDTTIAQSEKNHIKVGSSMIINMQMAPPISRTTCCDILINGYLRMYHQNIYKTMHVDIVPILIQFLDPNLKWCLNKQEPKILQVSQKKDEWHLYLNKNDWKSLSISTKYIVHDIILEEQTCDDSLQQTFVPYTISIINDKVFGSNLIDIQWLCRIISTNPNLHTLRISNCKHLLEWNKFHFFVQNSFLKMLNHDVTYEHLTEICIDSYKDFNDECFRILIDVIDAKCPSLTHLKLYRTDIGNASVMELISFLSKTKNGQHPLWYIDIEFCPKINDDALDLLCNYLISNPVKKMHIKCTGKNIQNDQIWEEQRLSVSIYPT